jgi:integrase
MSIRKRTWKTAKGDAKEAWVVDYVDQAGKRRLKTFGKQKEADAFNTRARFEITQGMHTPDSDSITVAKAAEKWLETCRVSLEIATIDSYEQHVRLHIKPYLGRVKLSQLTVPAIRDFEDRLRRGDPAPGETEGKPRSPAMVRRVMTSLSTMLSDSEERGLIARNVARDLRSKRKTSKDRKRESRHNGKLKVGISIPSPAEIRAFVAAGIGQSS